jgi:hypothetical protein
VGERRNERSWRGASLYDLHQGFARGEREETPKEATYTLR